MSTEILDTVFQGDRGYDGPRGSRGLTGFGVKGGMVMDGSAFTARCHGNGVEINSIMFAYPLYPISTYIFPQGSHGEPGMPGPGGAPGEGIQGEKVAICSDSYSVVFMFVLLYSVQYSIQR